MTYDADLAAMAASREDTARVASVMLRLVTAELGSPPSALIDVGCGAGHWVREFCDVGIDAHGIDGNWARPHLVIPHERFSAQDLESPISGARRFDLAVCLEVAEHLSPDRGPGFVADLCALADAVLFSAAIPRQPGTHHVNLRWQSYWVALFVDHGFGAIDCIRSTVWTLPPPRVAYVFAQQCFLFVRGSGQRLALPVDVVHPDLYLQLTYPVGARRVMAELPRSFERSARHHLQSLIRRVR